MSLLRKLELVSSQIWIIWTVLSSSARFVLSYSLLLSVQSQVLDSFSKYSIQVFATLFCFKFMALKRASSRGVSRSIFILPVLIFLPILYKFAAIFFRISLFFLHFLRARQWHTPFLHFWISQQLSKNWETRNTFDKIILPHILYMPKLIRTSPAVFTDLDDDFSNEET